MTEETEQQKIEDIALTLWGQSLDPVSISKWHLARVAALESQLAEANKDTERLEWLQKQFGCALINDDNGHWAMSWAGMQNVPEGDGPQDIQTSFFIEAKEWHDGVTEAIDAARKGGPR